MRVEFNEPKQGGYCIFTDNSIEFGMHRSSSEMWRVEPWKKVYPYKDINYIELKKAILFSTLHVEDHVFVPLKNLIIKKSKKW